MTFKVTDAGGVIRTITKMTVRDGATLRPVLRLKFMDGASLRTVATFSTPVTLAITPANQAVTGSTNPLTSTAFTATPTGGTGPFSYAWTVTSGTGSATSPTSASTTVGSGALTSGVASTVNLQCVATDSLGQTATATTYATFTYTAPILDTQTVTADTYTFNDYPAYYTEYGFRTGLGSISDGTSNLYGGASIVGLYNRIDGDAFSGATSTGVVLAIDGTRANSGWESMTVGSTTLTRASASYSVSGGVTYWSWNRPVSSNPFDTSTIVTFS